MKFPLFDQLRAEAPDQTDAQRSLDVCDAQLYEFIKRYQAVRRATQFDTDLVGIRMQQANDALDALLTTLNGRSS